MKKLSMSEKPLKAVSNAGKIASVSDTLCSIASQEDKKKQTQAIDKLEVNETSKDFFNHAIHKSEDLYIENLQNIPNNLLTPHWYKEFCDISDLIVYPIVVKDKHIGLYYADRKNSWPKLSDWQFKYIKVLRNQTALALKLI